MSDKQLLVGRVPDRQYLALSALSMHRINVIVSLQAIDYSLHIHYYFYSSTFFETACDHCGKQTLPYLLNKVPLAKLASQIQMFICDVSFKRLSYETARVVTNIH